jgi:hypothetical protein
MTGPHVFPVDRMERDSPGVESGDLERTAPGGDAGVRVASDGRAVDERGACLGSWSRPRIGRSASTSTPRTG